MIPQCPVQLHLLRHCPYLTYHILQAPSHRIMSCSNYIASSDVSFCRSKPQIRFRFERCRIGIIAGLPFIRSYLSTITRRQVGDPGFVSQQSKASFSSLTRPYLLWCPIYSPGKWETEFFTSAKRLENELTTRFHLVPRLRMSGGIESS